MKWNLIKGDKENDFLFPFNKLKKKLDPRVRSPSPAIIKALKAKTLFKRGVLKFELPKDLKYLKVYIT